MVAHAYYWDDMTSKEFITVGNEDTLVLEPFVKSTPTGQLLLTCPNCPHFQHTRILCDFFFLSFMHIIVVPSN